MKKTEETLWEKRMHSGRDGRPVPIVSMAPKLISHKECERLLDKALYPSLWERLLQKVKERI